MATKWRSEGYPKWNKKYIQGTNSEGKEAGTQINDLKEKEEVYIHLKQKEETRIPKKWEEGHEPLEQL